MALDPYYQLGIERNATAAQIEAAWRQKRRETHPDRNQDDPYATTKFQQCKEAYDILRDRERRQRFDRGEDPRKINVHEVALQQIVLAMNKVCQQTVQGVKLGNIVEHLTTILDEQLQELRKAPKQIEAALKQLARLSRRFKRRSEDGQANVLRETVEGQIDAVKREREQITIRIESVVAALKLLEQYEDEEAGRLLDHLQSHAQQGGVWIVYGASGTGDV